MGGAFSLGDSLLGFVLAATLGLALGYAIGRIAALARRFSDDAPTSILITLMAPYLAWMLAEYAHASAVLACVAGGITLRRAPATDLAPERAAAGDARSGTWSCSWPTACCSC